MKDDLISRSALDLELQSLVKECNRNCESDKSSGAFEALHRLRLAPAVDAETVMKSLPYVKEALEMAKQSLVPVVQCIDCRYLKTCNRTIELIPRQAQIGYLRCVVHSCEYGERRADDA